MHPDKSSLSIRLTQPVIPLRCAPERTSRHHDGEMLPPAVVRGLLTIKLAKPAKVSSIQVELQAKATTHYTQAAGRTRIEVTEQYKVHSASMVVFKANPALLLQQRVMSARPRVQFLDIHTGSTAQQGPRRYSGGHWQSLPDPHPSSRSASLDPRSLTVRHHPGSDELETDHGRIPRHDQTWMGPAPPYPSLADPHTFLNVDFQDLSVARRSQSVASTSSGIMGLQRPSVLTRHSVSPDIPRGSPVSSEYSIRDLALSRTSSIEEVPEDEVAGVDPCAQQPDNVAYYGLSRIATGSSGRSSVQDPRGRSHSRFSLKSIVHVVDAVKNRVRSQSPQAGSHPWSDEQELERGRSLAKGKAKAKASPGVRHVLSHIGVAEPLSADGTNNQQGDGWVVFPEGTYTYPIFFTIPNNSPPTTKAEHGSLTWRVKAEVKRLGTFTSKMTASQEIIVVSLPADDEFEDVEGVDLEKQWEDQFRYRVQIAGRGFPVGGKVPLQLTITPLAKIKVHSISICLDERTEYYTKTQSRARSDTIRRTTLVMIRHNGLVDRYTRPILPLTSEDADAFHKSPLYHFLHPGENESEVASSFMGPGPWTICHELKVPESCAILHPSNQAKGSNIMVNHTLKVTMRVEKEQEAETTGKKKLYDIIIHIPILILSCRCTSEWTSLPCYYEALQSDDDDSEDTSTCPCRTRPKAKARTQYHDTQSNPLDCFTSLPTMSSSRSRRLAAFSSDSLASRTFLYEQLVSGLVSERGEAPPSYERIEVVYT